MHKIDTKAIFEYLDNLNPSEVVNIYDYAPTLKQEFKLGEKETKQLLNQWLRTFSERHLAKQEAEQNNFPTYEPLELAS